MSGVGEGSSGGHHGAPAIVPPAIPPAVGDDRLEKTLDEMQEEVDAVTAPLLAHHFPPGVFNVEAALMEGFSYKPFLKLIKKVAALHEQGILQQSIWEGTTKKFWLLHSMCTRKEFVTFARWLSTQEGQDAMFSHQRSVKLQKRASEKITPDQIAYVQVLDFQRQKYSAEVKETRVDFESDIAELQERLRLKRREMEEALKALDVKYLPASSYVEPEDEMVGKTALELYEQECLKTGKRMKTLPGEKVEYAKAHFGSEARQRFMIEFAEKEEHRDLLMRFLGEQVLTFRRTANASQERKFRHYMAVIGGVEATEAAIALAEATHPLPPRRQPVPTQPDQGDLPPRRTRKARDPKGKAPVGVRRETRAKQKARAPAEGEHSEGHSSVRGTEEREERESSLDSRQ
ncbi:TPA_asm: hypothetical protein [Melastoma malabathricum amalgavirus 1]|nr:TPA_asm: hypothetical protein [Melastoma malabathricum amalgavirus 1]